MNAAIFIYIADVLSSLGVFLVITGIIGLIIAGCFTAFYAVEEQKYHGYNWVLIVPTVALVVACLIPSSKTMYMMAGAVLGEQALESKVGQQLKEMVELKLDQELVKMKQEAKK